MTRNNHKGNNMKLTSIIVAAALLASPAYALEQPLPSIIIEQPQPEPQPVPTPTPDTPTPETPRKSSGGSGVDGLAILGVVVGLIIMNELSKDRAPDLTEPRPQVRPEGCLNKRGEVVACEF
jgi:hypothetical protein